MGEVRFKVSFGRTRRGPTPHGPVPSKLSGKAEPAATREAESQPHRPVSRTARLLALAYYVERQVEARAIKDYAEAARVLGMSRGRMTQVMDLRWLPSKAQEAILMGGNIVTERHLRRTSIAGRWSSLTTALFDPASYLA